MKVTTLTTDLLKQAFQLDRKWFGEHGISESELKTVLDSNPENSIAIFDLDSKLSGLAIFAVLINTTTADYVVI